MSGVFCLPLLLAGLIWTTESALTFKEEPPSPKYSVEGTNAVFEWIYSEVNKTTELKSIVWTVENRTVPGTSYVLMVEKVDGTATVNPDIPAAYANRVVKKDQATLVIKSTTFDDSTSFSCALKSKVAPAFDKISPVQLVVTGPASISPRAQYAQVGSSFTLTCTAKDVPSQIFFWIREGQTEKLGDGPQYSIVSVTGSSQLTIKNVTVADSGYYVCNATIKSSQQNPAVVHLQVPYPPEQDKTSCPSSSYNVMMGTNQTICCPVSGSPPPVITWEKDGIQLQKGEKNALIVTAKTDKDFGNYTCTAKAFESSVGPFVIRVNKKTFTDTGELSVTFADGTVEKAAKLNVQPQAGAENYVVKITGEDILDDFLIGTQTSLEFHYNALVMKEAGKKPDDIAICVNVTAMSDNAIIAKTPTCKELTIKKPSDTKN